MTPRELVRTTHAACLIISVAGEFPDEEDRQLMADTATVLEDLPELTGLGPQQAELAMEALLLTFRGQREADGRQASEAGPLATLLTEPQVAMAYMVLADHHDRLGSEQYDLVEALLASVALSLYRLETVVVMTPELRQQRQQLIGLRDQMEDLLHTTSPLEPTDTERYQLRVSLIENIRLLEDDSPLVSRLRIPDDLRAALTIPRLQAAYQQLLQGERVVATA